MTSLVQIGQVAPKRSLLEMIQQLAEQEHQMLVEARKRALEAPASTRGRRSSRSTKVKREACFRGASLKT
jgi:hypothetical protein